MEKNAKSNYKYLIIAMIGILLLLIDLSIPIGYIYPNYEMSNEINWEFQHYTLNLHYGTVLEKFFNYATNETIVSAIHFSKFRIDIFNDFIGYILLFFSMKALSKKSKIFLMGSIMAVIAFAINVVILILPFFLQSEILCYAVFFIGIAGFAATMLIGYALICGVADVLSGVQFKGERRAIYIAWFLSFVCHCIVSLTTWLGLGKMTIMYNIFLLFSTLFYLFKIFQVRDYFAGYKTLGETEEEAIQ